MENNAVIDSNIGRNPQMKEKSWKIVKTIWRPSWKFARGTTKIKIKISLRVFYSPNVVRFWMDIRHTKKSTSFYIPARCNRKCHSLGRCSAISTRQNQRTRNNLFCWNLCWAEFERKWRQKWRHRYMRLLLFDACGAKDACKWVHLLILLLYIMLFISNINPKFWLKYICINRVGIKKFYPLITWLKFTP